MVRSRHQRPAPRRQAGFSLIELVAAFVVFALGFGVLMQILSASIRTAHQAADYTQAALWAQSKLDLVGIGEKIKPGRSSGRFDDEYRWELDISRYQAPDSAPDLQSVTAIELYRVDLEVLWGDRRNSRSSHFVTLRSMSADPTGGGAGIPGSGIMPGGAMPSPQFNSNNSSKGGGR